MYKYFSMAFVISRMLAVLSTNSQENQRGLYCSKSGAMGREGTRVYLFLMERLAAVSAQTTADAVL